jgi:ribokinase
VVEEVNRQAPTILVVGSTMTDMIAYTERVPSAGETVTGDEFSLGFGGKGANQAVMCALLGASVTFVGSLGNDVFGRMTLENLASFGIDTSPVLFTDQAASGAAPIWVDRTGENRIIVVPGANNLLDPEVVTTAIAMVRADAVLMQFEIPEPCVEAALRAANDVGSITIVNPAPMRTVPQNLLSHATWVIANRSELDAIAGLLTITPTGSLVRLVDQCAAALRTNLVVTLGVDGVLVHDRAEASTVAVPAPRADVVDTTGAGDAFVGAFAYAVALGVDDHAAAAFGCACAAASVEAPGTQTSFPRGRRLDELKLGLHSSDESVR